MIKVTFIEKQKKVEWKKEIYLFPINNEKPIPNIFRININFLENYKI